MHTDSMILHTSFSHTLSKRLHSAEREKLERLKSEHHTLLGELYDAKKRLQTAWNNFDYLYEAKPVDVCIYKIQTYQSQYDNILRKLKALRREMDAFSV